MFHDTSVSIHRVSVSSFSLLISEFQGDIGLVVLGPSSLTTTNVVLCQSALAKVV